MTDAGSPLIDFLKTMAALGGILALAWAGLRLWLPKVAGAATSRGSAIEILGSRPLEARKTLYLIRVGERTMLVASAGDNVTLLDHVEPPPVEDPLPTFAGQLRRWRKA